MILTAREFKARQEWVKKHLLYVAVPVVDAMQGGSASPSVPVPGAPVLSIDSYPSSTSVLIEWTEPSGSPTNYKIFVDDVLWDQTDTTTNYLIEGQTPGVPIDIYVVAYNDAGDGDPSNTVTADTSDYFPTVTNSRLWLSRDRNLYTDTAGTTPAALNDSIASWRAVGGGWGTDLLTQGTSSQRPVLKSNGIQADGVDDRLAFPSTLTISGDFTLYTVLTKTDDAVQDEYAGDGTANNYLGWFSNFAYGFCNGTHSVDVLDTGVSALASSIRRIRRSGSTWYYKRAGLAEASKAGSSADFPLTMLLRSARTLASNKRFQQFVLVNKLIAPSDADDLAIIAKLQELESGVTGP